MRAVHLFAAVAAVSTPHFCGQVLAQTLPQTDAAKRDFFESRIRPVLIERCYECHNSVDASEGDFVLDHREALLEGGTGGNVIEVGDPKASRLIAILRHEVEGLEMPEGGPKLDDQVIADFEKWIADGATDPRDKPPSEDEFAKATAWETKLDRRKQWWCFQPIRDVTPPGLNHGTMIDGFVERKLDDAGLRSSRPADVTTLVRRLFVNLIGLPPAPEESLRWAARIEAAEGRDAAVTELVNDLLDRPEFGERWARHWMDWIRYADSHGSEGDPEIANAWHYRDYLIRALNADVPVSQLLREHVAGDLLAKPRINRELGINESAIGPAHFRMVFHGFAPTDALDERVRFTDDQINAFSKAFLGLTVSCARCHDHKFDAISQKDYYAMFGVLAACRPSRTVIDLPEREELHLVELRRLKTMIRKSLAEDWRAAAHGLAARLSRGKWDEREKTPAGLLAVMESLRRADRLPAAWDRQRMAFETERKTWQASEQRDALRRWDFARASDREGWNRAGTGFTAFDEETSFAIASSGDRAVIGIYPRGLYSHSISDKHPARLTSPDVVLEQDSELWMRIIGDGGASARYVVRDYPRNGTVYPVGKATNSWRWQKYDLDYWTGENIHVELTAAKDAPLLYSDQARSWFGVREVRLIAKGEPSPQEFREFLIPIFEANDRKPPESLEQVASRFTSAIREAIEAWSDNRASDAQAMLLDVAIRERVLPNELETLPKTRPLMERYRELENAIPSPTRVPGLEDVGGRKQPIYVRGDHKKPGELVPNRFLEAIDAAPYASDRAARLQLADDLLRDDNPLTRRVIVNRVWHHLFGQGIVRTPDNFGRLGDQPSHPELLDWLALEFQRRGWSLKTLVRMMVMSKTWQQSATSSESADRTDPDNRLLSHANVRRLEAEAIRDSLLAVSASLDKRRGGPPVNGDSTRRSVYIRVKRNALDPFLRVFDFPEPFSSVGRRDVTNVPAQSLTMMNDAAVTRYAKGLAGRVLNERLGGDEERIGRLFRIALARAVTPAEVDRASRYRSATQRALEDAVARRSELQASAIDCQTRIDAILEPVQARLQAELDADPAKAASRLPKPVASWDFTDSIADSLGTMDGALRDGATLSGGLRLDGQGYLVTKPITQTIKAKTLEAWVRIDKLRQRGGGVMTLQTPNGAVFDSIVFGERDPQEWLAGSNNFARTQPFSGPKERDAKQKPIHIAITYQPNGMITGYRNGQPYGRSYKSDGPIEFRKGQAVVSFGVRHLPSSPGRLLSGLVYKANLYDRALSPDEIEATATGNVRFVSDQEVRAALSRADRESIDMLRREIGDIETQIATLGRLPTGDLSRESWNELARAILTLKEFLYVR